MPRRRGAKKDEKCRCMWHAAYGWKMLILGLLVLINTYWPFSRWDAFIGVLLVLMGFVKVAMPCKCE